jgi:hypothetical protein
MVADVRYVFGDILSGEIIAEVPLQGVSVMANLGGGEFRGTCFLDQTGKTNEELTAATEPGRCYVVVERDEKPIWGGMIWTSTYQSQSKTRQIFGKDLKSYPESRFIRVDQNLSGEQTDLFLQLYELMQAYDNSIEVELPSPIATGVSRTVEVLFTEFRTFKSELDKLADNPLGFDWLIRWTREGGVYRKTLVLGYPTIGSPVNHGTVTFDYYDQEGAGVGGNILNYWENSSMVGTGTHIYGLGGGEGDLQYQASAIHQDLLDGGFPRFEQDVQFKDVFDTLTLTNLTNQQAAVRKAPASVLTVEVKGDGDPSFGDYDLGDVCRIVIQDPRYPEGILITKRLLAYEYYPSSDDNVEYARLSFEGDDLT